MPKINLTRTVLLLLLLACSLLGAADIQDSALPIIPLVYGDLSPAYKLALPDGEGKFPCVIICPGRGYHMERPLIKGMAEKAVKNGFASFRFDWSFFSNKGNPSQDGSAELKDIESMLALARANPRIDTTRIYIAGKSMGSLLAYAKFSEDKSIKGCILLTPILSTAAEGDLYYPGLNTEKRPVVFILGDKDTDNCPVKELYQYLGTCETAFPVVVLAGGHSFEMGYNDSDLELTKTNEFNVNAAIDTAVFWLKTFENRR